ncbi:hypothetical protein [Exiguobacterium sp. S3]|uniref:hypothetical protein n=1 Tax=Exiguobacterium sp. S3 TaxID=483245 RepID=UPI001BEABD98|nr:hypothetical protein [Exiguobacterium sp. S3]
MKFYQKTWFVVLMLLLFFPVGLFLMWRYQKFNQIARIIITVIIALAAIPAFTGGSDETATDPALEETPAVEAEADTSEEDKAAAEEAAKKEAEEAKKKEEQEKALAEAQAAEEAKGKQPAGNYKVGTDIDAGTYLIVADGGMTYYQLAKDSTGELTSIITNDNIIGHAILTMNEGEYLTVSSGWFMPLDKVTDELKPKSGYYMEGMYRVGTDIPAGEYQIEPTSGMGYYEITNGTRGNLMDIVTNNNIESPTYVTISAGQILKMNGTQVKVK